jgi:hypothetical protein
MVFRVTAKPAKMSCPRDISGSILNARLGNGRKGRLSVKLTR